uniref:Uncharacterized protein n=1 Tax=Brassica oleracea var. oleracea TaxID=109376 RepID=A0A0D3DJA4_BRAOL
MEKGEKIDGDRGHETATECGGGGRRSPGGLVGGGVARLSPETRMGGLSPEEWCGSACCRGPVVLSKKKKRKPENTRSRRHHRRWSDEDVGICRIYCILYILFVFYYILLNVHFVFNFFLIFYSK